MVNCVCIKFKFNLKKPIDLYPAVKVVTDFALTETPDGTHGQLIGSSVAPVLVFGEGPTMAAQYRDEAKGFDSYIIRKWQEPKVVIREATTKICT